MKYALSLTVLLLVSTLASSAPTSSTRAPATTEPAVTGTIFVKVIQGSAGGTKVAGALVTANLGGHGSNDKARILTTKADEKGVAVFQKIPLTPPFHPRVTVTHGGTTFEAECKGPDDIMSLVDTERMITVVVHDITEEPPAWEVVRRDITLLPSPHGLFVSDTLLVHNPSDRTWLSAPDAKGARASVVLPLPAGAKDVPKGMHGGTPGIGIVDGKIVSPAPLPPGQSRFSLRYILPSTEVGALSKTTVELVAPVLTRDLIVHVPHRKDVTFSAEDMTAGRVYDAGRGRLMQEYMTPDLPAATTVSMVITTPVMAQPTEQDHEEHVSQLPQMLVLVGGGAIIVTGAIMLRIGPRKKKKTNANKA